MHEEGRRRWVGSNNLVELKKRFFSLIFENMKKELICTQDYLLVCAKFILFFIFLKNVT